MLRRQNTEQIVEMRRQALVANLAKLEETDEALLKRYREKTQLNKPAPGIRRSLLERQADSGGNQGSEAFEQSERLIKAAEQMTNSLKYRRAKCQEAIHANEEAVQQLDARIAAYRHKLDVVRASYNSRCEERDRLRLLLADSMEKSASLMLDCGVCRTKSRRDDHLRSRAFATVTLRAERGFSCATGSTCTAKEARERSLMSKRAASRLSTLSGGSQTAISTSTPSLAPIAAASKTLALSKSSFL